MCFSRSAPPNYIIPQNQRFFGTELFPAGKLGFGPRTVQNRPKTLFSSVNRPARGWCTGAPGVEKRSKNEKPGASKTAPRHVAPTSPHTARIPRALGGPVPHGFAILNFSLFSSPPSRFGLRTVQNRPKTRFSSVNAQGAVFHGRA